MRLEDVRVVGVITTESLPQAMETFGVTEKEVLRRASILQSKGLEITILALMVGWYNYPAE